VLCPIEPVEPRMAILFIGWKTLILSG